MDLAKVKAWLKTHRKQAAAGAAGLAVAVFALYRRRAAQQQGLAVGFQPQQTAGQDAAAGAYDQFTAALGQLSDQQQQQSGAMYDALGQIAQGLSAGQSSLADAMAANAAAQQQATGGLLDSITGALTQPAVAAAPRPAQKTPTQGVYTFQPGDTPGAVAAKYGVTVDQLLVANSKSGAGFADAGHRVTVPVATAPSTGAKPDIRYQFKAGETYASVAKQFGLTEAQLRAMNPKAGTGSGKPGTAITIRG